MSYYFFTIDQINAGTRSHIFFEIVKLNDFMIYLKPKWTESEGFQVRIETEFL